MKHLPTILFAILAALFLFLYLTKETEPIPDTKPERDRLRYERDSLLGVVSTRDKQIQSILDSLKASDGRLADNQKELDKLKNRPPYAPPNTIVAAATEWDSIFAANGITGHAYLLIPNTK